MFNPVIAAHCNFWMSAAVSQVRFITASLAASVVLICQLPVEPSWPNLVRGREEEGERALLGIFQPRRDAFNAASCRAASLRESKGRRKSYWQRAWVLFKSHLINQYFIVQQCVCNIWMFSFLWLPLLMNPICTDPCHLPAALKAEKGCFKPSGPHWVKNYWVWTEMPDGARTPWHHASGRRWSLSSSLAELRPVCQQPECHTSTCWL